MRLAKTLHIIVLAAAMALATAMTGCETVDTERIPAVPVNVTFRGEQMWTAFGVTTPLQYRRFIKQLKEPTSFFYVVSDYTGYGGLLLAADYYGNPVVYDLACPVECKPDVRVVVNADSHIAECPKCHSTYAVFENYGIPLSGLAKECNYGLKRYRVSRAANGDYMITR